MINPYLLANNYLAKINISKGHSVVTNKCQIRWRRDQSVGAKDFVPQMKKNTKEKWIKYFKIVMLER